MKALVRVFNQEKVLVGGCRVLLIVKTLWTFVSSSRKQQIVLANVTSLREAPDNLSLEAGHTDLGPVSLITELQSQDRVSL